MHRAFMIGRHKAVSELMFADTFVRNGARLDKIPHFFFFLRIVNMNAFDACRAAIIVGDSKINDAVILGYGNMGLTLASRQKGESR